MKNISDENIKENEEKIMNAALTLFTQKGYEAVGVQEICELSQITKPTLYYYFGSKEGVFNRIMDIYFGKFNKMLDGVCIYCPNPNSYYEDIYPVLLKIALSYFNFAQQYPEFYSMVLGSVWSYGSSPSVQQINTLLSYQTEKLAEVFKAIGNVHTNMKHKEYLLATTYLGLVNSFIYQWYRDKTRLDELLAKSLVHQYMHGIHAS